MRRPMGLYDQINSAYLSYETCLTMLRDNLQEIAVSETSDVTVSELLGQARNQAATNPKDAVYGTYGILQKLNLALGHPDYSRSVHEIHTETTKLAIRHDNSLEILLQAFESPELPDLPSWVPDWHVILTHGLNPLLRMLVQDASRRLASPAEIKFLKEDMALAVRGYFIDRLARRTNLYIPSPENGRIVRVTEHSNPTWVDIATTKTFREWIFFAQAHHTPQSGIPTNEIIIRTLTPFSFFVGTQRKNIPSGFGSWLPIIVSGSSLEGPRIQSSHKGRSGSPENRSSGTSSMINSTLGITRMQDSQLNDPEAITRSIFMDNKASDFHIMAYDRCLGTRLFVTENGYIGRGLKELQEGDYVVLIPGVSMPVIVLKDGDTYRLKSPSHVEGIMDGEKWPDNEDDLVDITLR